MSSLNKNLQILRRRMKLTAPLLILGCAGYANTLSVNVAGNAGPWLYSNQANGGLNTAYQYGVGDEAAPTVVDASDGLSFAPGNGLTIKYVSGQVSAGGGFPYVDGLGDTAAIFNNGRGSSGQVAPSNYMNPATYPIYLTELVGAFANSAGTIVGLPFAIGDGPLTLAIPTGATALQLGVNDDIYSDNYGSFVVDVTATGSSTTTPEPTALTCLGGTLIGGSLLLCRGKQAKT